MKKILMLVALFLSFAINEQLLAQPFRLAAGIKKVDSKLIVQIKFLNSEEIVNNNAVDIYRKENGDTWKKINTDPIKKTEVSKSIDYSKQEEMLQIYASFILRKTNSKSEENNSLALAGLTLLANNKFAQLAGCYYEDNTAIAGHVYEYKIMDASKSNNVVSDITSITVAANYLKPVTEISFTQKKQDIRLTWKRDSQHYLYNIYRSTSLTETPKLLSDDAIFLPKENKNADNTFYADSFLTKGSTYYYYISGIDVLGNESKLSAPLTVNVKDKLPPQPVAGLTSKQKSKTIELKWKASTDKDAKGYNVYRNTNKDSVPKKINTELLPVTATSFIDTKTEEGQVYGYTIESVDEAGNKSNSIVSKSFMPDQTPPAKPNGLKGITKPGFANIDWNANKEKDIKGYWVYRSTSTDKNYFSLINATPIKATSFIDSLPLVSTNKYVYKIQAVDESYNKSELSDTIVLMVPDITPPKPASELTAKTSERSTVALSWQPSVDKDVAGYNIFRNTNTDTTIFEKLNATPVTQTSFIDNNKLPQGNTIAYYITAIDKSGNISAPSISTFVTVDIDTANMQPAENIAVTKNERDSSVTVSWKNNADNIKGFIVFRKRENQQNFSAISSLITSSNFKDEKIDKEENNTYYVRTYFTNNSFKNSIVSK